MNPQQSISPQESPWIREVIQETKPWGLFEKLKLSFVVFWRVFRKLDDKGVQDRVYRFSVQRDSSVSDATLRIIDSGFSLLPTNSDSLDFVPKKSDVVTSVKLIHPIKFKIETKDGFVFYDWEGSKKQYSTYWLFRDFSKRLYTPLTYCAASAVYRSFSHGDCRVPGDQYLPKEGGTIIEAGAYVGYKAVAFGRRLGSSGKVIAIELSPENFELLAENIKANQMEDRIQPLNCAVWSEDTELMLKGVSRMNYSVASVDEKSPPEIHATKARSLDSIIEEFEVDTIDFLNLQLNGAELEAIKGLQKHWSKVSYLNIITRFHKDGVLLVEQAREILEARGALIVVDSRCGHLYNLTAKLNTSV